MSPVRELTLAKVDHPQHLRFVAGEGSLSLQRLDHPALAKVVDGDPAKGWEGDPRLTILYSQETDQWVLVRQRPDKPSQYMAIATMEPGKPIGLNIIDELVKHDSRRGYDAKQSVDAHNAKVEAAAQKHAAEAAAERWLRFAHEARKAGGFE